MSASLTLRGRGARPLVQGGMGVGISAHRLAGAVAREDCVGTISSVDKPGDGGLIALGRDGSIVLACNTAGMFRAAADARGRFETAIW